MCVVMFTAIKTVVFSLTIKFWCVNKNNDNYFGDLLEENTSGQYRLNSVGCRGKNKTLEAGRGMKGDLGRAGGGHGDVWIHPNYFVFIYCESL